MTECTECRIRKRANFCPLERCRHCCHDVTRCQHYWRSDASRCTVCHTNLKASFCPLQRCRICCDTWTCPHYGNRKKPNHPCECGEGLTANACILQKCRHCCKQTFAHVDRYRSRYGHVPPAAVFCKHHSPAVRPTQPFSVFLSNDRPSANHPSDMVAGFRPGA